MFKYLGHVINDTLSDNHIVMRQMTAIYARGNMIINNFKLCTEEVKGILYKTFVSIFFSHHSYGVIMIMQLIQKI